ncbi:MAG: ATP-binding protein [Chromatiales bacterium]|nr:ATP-binding protein [Chromatiales bacterium]
MKVTTHFRHRNLIAGLIIALVAFMLIASALVTAHQRQLLRDTLRADLEQHANVIAALVQDALLREDYAAVADFVARHVQDQPDIVRVNARMQNGFAVADYRRAQPARHSIVVERRVDYRPDNHLTLTLETDLQSMEATLSTLNRHLVLVTIGVTLLFGIAMWMLFRRMAILPLQTEIAARTRIEAALREQQQELERRVAERTEAVRRAYAELEQKAAAIARSNDDLEQFAYIASHDLQEPLRMVSNYVSLLEHRYAERLDDEAREFMHFAVEGAQRMQQLIHDLLAYSRISTRPGAPAAVPIETALDEAIADLRTAIDETGAAITRDALPVVRADPTQLRQLFMNLLGNAIKFGRDNVPCRIHVAAERIDGQWRIDVHDNGIGIEPRHQERIFEIFQRLHERERYPGTGIGLALCRRIVERNGGRIWVESTPGEGSTFHFTLPAEPA